MIEPSSFFERNLAIIFFVYGLSFFAMAFAVLLTLKPLAKIGLAAAALYLILFSLIHGTVEWIDMYAQYKFIAHGLRLSQGAGMGRFFLLMASFYFLLLFGLELTMRQASRVKTHVIIGVNALFLFSVVYLVFSGILAANIKELESTARFLLGFPSAIFVAIGLYRLSLNDYFAILTEDYKWYFKVAAWTFVLYGVFAGLVGPKSNTLLASLFNQELFFKYTGIPIQILRASAALFISYSIIRAMPLSIVIRILGSLAAVAVIVLVVWFTSYMNFAFFHANHDKILKLVAEEKDFSYIYNSFNRLHSLMSQPDIIRNRQAYKPLIKEYAEDFGSALNRVKTMDHSDAEEREVISQILILSQPVIRLETTNISDANLNRLKLMIDKISSMHSNEIKENEEQALNTSKNANQIMLIAFLSCVLGAAFIGYHNAKLIIRPINKLRIGAEKIAEGDLAHRINIRTADELQHFAADFNTMAEKLQDKTIKLENLAKEFEELSITDGLTGLFNHRHFYSRAEIEFERAKRYNEPFSLLMLDVDNFKHYNDKYGHPSGDKLLETIGSLIRTHTRSSDIACRYGGEEFAILLPETDKSHAVMAAEKIRRIIQSHEFPHRKTQPLGDITVSIGVASYPADEKGVKKISELIEKADNALYEAKNRGKNRVCVS